MSDLFEVNYVDIRPQQLAKGLSQWHAASSDVESGYAAAQGEIQRLNAAEPWGHDTAGAAFRSAYMQGDGPDTLIKQGGELAAKVVELGPTVRRSAENARGMDGERAREVREILKRV
ncbi:hypothetical protein SAMN05421833_102225 [Microbispora rosea]|uniref:Excreted virulence factor EspC, type VII ESX diderm n=1 Tax=Microbispora rosea TaxID=58117 RepID=A0A1N6T4Y2_9ACTN|nr:hypothetical protein [Microbispora rosea]GIH45199.1 hypothetical protein Mro03_03780 [Microbispora rosea subsp. rosea]SIQ48455.1 hypothetical protein SAMN05421833_102225 [Microbispora rosea]